MADTVEVVIKIPKDIYESRDMLILPLLNKGNAKVFQDLMVDALKNGTVLPKGHGDLIDRNKLKQAMKIGYRIVDDAETVIKADSEVE